MNVLILGNGFDLDVNYKTRYSDFAKNVRLCWPSIPQSDADCDEVGHQQRGLSMMNTISKAAESLSISSE